MTVIKTHDSANMTAALARTVIIKGGTRVLVNARKTQELLFEELEMSAFT